MDDKAYVIRYGKHGTWHLSAPMTRKVADKQAKLLELNGFEVEVLRRDQVRVPANQR
ncbi:hypothetical protein GCM10010885_16290 [Alicyclobacillus cellulosilyticus]|uniref:Uncharacterized protein n=1 Tax=Alicyclobacillus cellulosilyticus TaxID=1003997 RepID=A0A917NM11_9BACL|nr:hypothetical protein [Alicyclobacillus cellulosilyticus]GGJ07904.1 hypothetical protein GCM10010885_16290 [Alicyclobacillus cellulosilyticus]